MQADEKHLKCEIPPACEGMRMDKALAALFPGYSRSAMQKWLKQGLIVVDDEIPSQRDRVQGGEQVELVVPEIRSVTWQPEPVALTLVHEDEHLIVVNKPAGLVVHPGAGNPRNTLVNGLLHHDGGLSILPRAGIVHRLDKDTTGLMVVARTESARLALIDQLAKRSLGRTYLALVQGVPVSGGTIDEPVGRDRHDRRRMAVASGGKPAVTHFRVERRYRVHALLRCKLESGRTHQIRVHMRHIGFPLVGDPVYGGRSRFPPDSLNDLREMLQRFNRQALHAWKLRLIHPGTGASMAWMAPPPSDMMALCEALATDSERTRGD
jgi:23S rRNA pseudouridine1911/1915/1917 synthase